MSSPTESPKLLLIHGLLSTPLEFALVAQALRARGVAVEALEVPGYTLADRKKPVAWTNWLASLTDVLHERVSPGQPVILGGLCVGGILAAAIALRNPERVSGLALMSPSFDYDGWSLTHWRHLRKLGYALGLDRWISMAEREPFGIKNPKIRKWVARDMRERATSAAGPARLPLWGLRESERLNADVRDALSALSCPLLVLHAREDEITRLASVERLMSGLPLLNKELVVLEESYHMITIDNDRHRVADALARFARKCVQPLHSIEPPSAFERLAV